MKFKWVVIIALLCVCTLAGCGREQNPDEAQNPATELGGDDKTYGETYDELGVYDGDFDDGVNTVEIECVSGTDACYDVSDGVVTFGNITQDSVYTIKGELDGNIIIDVGDDYKFDLELIGFSIKSDETNPILILSGDEVTLKAKKDTENYVYDNREGIDETDETLYSGAIHSEVDLQLSGKGSLTVTSTNNKGIHTKDDLQVKNLTLTVVCCDNALKGNDSVEISGGNLTLIATSGDGIKTSNSDVSSKGNQRGTISIENSVITVYSACDGIDSAYDVVIDGEDTVLNVYTDKYSNYSQEVTATSSSEYYIRYTSSSYQYSIKYYNSDSDYEWVNATYHSVVSSMNRSYYYYSFPKKTEYSKFQLYIYSSGMEQGQEETYTRRSDYLTINTNYDTLALTSSGGSGMSLSWTNYTTSIQSGMGGGMGGGGMSEGNTEKGDYSTKGIKADNTVVINNGTINVKSYDDAIHANSDVTLENGETPLGAVTVNGGNITLYSNDDGMHADGTLAINGGNVSILNSYEGIEGNTITISSGNVSVVASDDGINATATSGTGVTLSGGYVYIYCSGDGIDANSRTSYTGISFEGGDAVIISTSSGNSAIDTEAGYKYTAGSIVAIMPRGGMSSEATHCSNFSSIGAIKTASFTSGQTVTVSGDITLSFTMPCSISNAYLITLNTNIKVSA